MEALFWGVCCVFVSCADDIFGSSEGSMNYLKDGQAEPRVQRDAGTESHHRLIEEVMVDTRKWETGKDKCRSPELIERLGDHFRAYANKVAVLIPTHPPHFDHARRLLSSYKKINPVDAELFFVFTEYNHPQEFISGFNSSHRFKFDNESKRGAACSCDIVKGEAMEAV
jgi:hypothetical protein